jgi:hypothetical protein
MKSKYKQKESDRRPKQNRFFYPDERVLSIMSQTTVQAKPCILYSGFGLTKTERYYKPYDYFWGTATLVQVEPDGSSLRLNQRY